MAEELMKEFPSYKELIEAKVRIDFLFAFAEVGEDGESKGDAITKHGIRALGVCRKLGVKDRVMGRADAEILLDGDWWEDASEGQRRALLDHEMHHLVVCSDQEGQVIRDDLKRPKLKMRKHDVEVGWFALVAGRHGSNSLEIEQAKAVMDSYGQLFWPTIGAQEPLQLSNGPTSDDERTPAKRSRKKK
jgi:hypothetical protein